MFIKYLIRIVETINSFTLLKTQLFLRCRQIWRIKCLLCLGLTKLFLWWNKGPQYLADERISVQQIETNIDLLIADLTAVRSASCIPGCVIYWPCGASSVHIEGMRHWRHGRDGAPWAGRGGARVVKEVGRAQQLPSFLLSFIHSLFGLSIDCVVSLRSCKYCRCVCVIYFS